MRAALALLVLAACGSDTPGMRLDVRANGTGAVRAELYLARAKCAQCDAIQPPMHDEKLTGTGYFLDGSAMGGTPETAQPLAGGRAVFDLRAPGDEDVSLPVALVVGYDAAGAIVAAQKLDDVAVPAGRTVWWKVDLEPALDRPSSDARMPAGRRVQVWRRGNPGVAACIGYEHADGTSDPQRIWLVPEDDLDCDEVPPPVDCDPTAFHQMGVAPVSSARCVTEKYSVPPATNTACLLGGDGCIDGTASTDTTSCARVDPYYCVPDALCTNPSCRGSLVQCAFAGMMTEMQCDIPYDAATGGPCGPAQAASPVSLDSFFVHPQDASQQVTCDDVNFADVSLTMPQLSKTITRGPLKLHATSVDSNATCAFQLVFDDNELTNGTSIPPLATFADLKLSNGRHVLLPFVLEFHAGTCTSGEGLRCTIVPLSPETLSACTAPLP